MSTEAAAIRPRDHSAPLITVFTATYNRGHTLQRLLESLKRQDYPNFEWVIVDDGSNDDTGSWAEVAIKSASFTIRYFYQNNQGKHIAFNRGVSEARGEFFLSVDSDDALMPQALSMMMGVWESIPAERRQQFTGVTGLCCDENGKPIGDLFPESPLDSDSATLTLLKDLRGDKIGFHRTEVLKEHPFPSDLHSRFVPEGRVWLEIAQTLQTRYVNAPLSIVFDSGPGRLSRLDRQARASGDYDYYRFAIDNFGFWAIRRPLRFFKMAISFNRARLHLGRKERLSSRAVIANILGKISLAPAFLLYVHDLIKLHGELGLWISISRKLPMLSASTRIGNLFRKIYLRKARPAIRCRANDLIMELEPWECVDGWVLFYPQLFDRNEISFLANRLTRGGLFLDVGANIGFYALTLSRLVPDGRVIAVEADPYNVNKLKKNIDLSCVDNVTIIPEGVSDKQETLSFRLNTTGNRGGNSFASDAPGDRIDVACRSLLQMLEGVGASRVDAMKIDIEGLEYAVLSAFFRDAPVSLFPRAIVIEVVPGWDARGGGDVLSLLFANGYRVCGKHEHNYMLDLADR